MAMTGTLFALALAASAGLQPCTTSAAQVVDDIYRQVLERRADPNSAGFTQALVSGEMSVRDVVLRVGQSPEHLERFFWRPLVSAVYRDVLNREPSPQEQDLASRALVSGETTVPVFVAQTATRAANNEPDAVHILYRRLLDRDPDPEGLRAHVQLAERSGLEAVVRSIMGSPEYRARLNRAGAPTEDFAAYRQAVRVLYRHVLGRDPDPEGLTALTEVAEVYGLPEVVHRMVTSREYTQQWGEQVIPGSDVRYCGAARTARPR